MDNILVSLCSRPNLGFNMNYFKFLLLNFVHLELLFFSILHVFTDFLLRINKPNKLAFKFFKMALTNILAQQVSILKARW